MKCPEWLEREHEEFVNKIRRDANFPDAEKKKFFEQVERECDGVMGAERTEQLGNVLKQWRLRGTALPVEPTLRLGRAHPLSGVRRALAAAGLRKHQVDSMMKDEIDGAENETRFEIIRDTLSSEDAELLKFTVWSFRDGDDPNNPYADVSTRDLPCRLGLPDDRLDPKAYIYLELALRPADRIYRPTALDAGVEFAKVWEPGGRTKPRPTCKERVRDGLIEVVHEPVPLNRISAAVPT